MLLEMKNVVKQFGGLTAVSNMSGIEGESICSSLTESSN